MCWLDLQTRIGIVCRRETIRTRVAEPSAGRNRLNPQTMPTCDNCGETVPLRKGVRGGDTEKAAPSCPECGDSVERDRRRSELRK